MNMKEYFKKMSDEEIKDEAQSLHSSINEVGCFGTKDVTLVTKKVQGFQSLLELTLRELERRGFEVEEKLRLTIKKG